MTRLNSKPSEGVEKKDERAASGYSSEYSGVTEGDASAWPSIQRTRRAAAISLANAARRK